MCNGSKAAKAKNDAKVGDVIGISTVGLHENHGRIGAFHATGQTTAQCVQCVQTGQKLTLSNIPSPMMRKFGFQRTEVATFNQAPVWHQDDQLVFDRNNATVGLKAFADQGVSVYVGVHEHDTGKVVDAIEQAALAGAAAHGDGGTVGGRKLVTAK